MKQLLPTILLAPLIGLNLWAAWCLKDLDGKRYHVTLAHIWIVALIILEFK